jgi:hypothetical protein
MDTLQFAENIPAEELAKIFREYFEQHMFVYNLLKGVEFVSLNNISFDKASIMYSVKLLNPEEKDKLAECLNSKSASMDIYGKTYTPKIFINGDLLCITITK